MNSTNALAGQSHRLLQLGVALLLFSSFEGFAIAYLAVPRLGLAAHTLSALQGILILALGLLWPRLHLSENGSRLAFWLLIYSAVAILVAYVLAAAWGAGNSTMPLAAGVAQGSTSQEMAIKIVAYSSAPTGILALTIILWGLRLRSSAQANGDQAESRGGPA